MVDTNYLFEIMKDSNTILSFKGEVSFDLIKSALDIIEGRLDKIEPNIKTRKKVFNVLVECLQNLSHHVEVSSTDDKIIDGKIAVLKVWTDELNYHVATGNYMLTSAVPKLKSWIEQINGYNKEELREFYRQILDNETFSAKGGGGLGFIDIARKSGQKLGFEFTQVDETLSFFSFHITISKES